MRKKTPPLSIKCYTTFEKQQPSHLFSDIIGGWESKEILVLSKLHVELEREEYQSRTAFLFKELLKLADQERYLVFDGSKRGRVVVAMARYALVHEAGRPHGVIFDIIVSEEYRRRYVGTALIKRILHHGKKAAPKAGDQAFFFEAHVPNHPAHLPAANAFFQKLSFTLDNKNPDSERLENVYRLVPA